MYSGVEGVRKPRTTAMQAYRHKRNLLKIVLFQKRGGVWMCKRGEELDANNDT